MERALPYNLEAEQSVLGSILIDPEAITQVADFLRPSDFYRNSHQEMYTAIIALYEQRESPDYITLCDALERRGTLEQAGGMAYIASLTSLVPTSCNVEYYGRLVERDAQYRRLIHAAGRIADLAYKRDEQAMAKAEEAIYQISQQRRTSRVSSIAEVMGRYMDHLQKMHEKRQRGVVTGVPTGFKVLDRVLGGLQPSDLITLAARPAQGKTSLCLNIASQVMGDSVGDGFKVMLFSLEMGEQQLARRLVSMETHIDQTRLRTGWVEEEEWEPLMGAAGRLSEGRLWIDDTPAISLSEMRTIARREQGRHGIDLIIVDYMQLMRATVQGERTPENRVQEVSLLSRGLKEVARELNVPVLALAQLSRAVEQRQDKVPQLSDLRESGSIEADSDVVMFIHQDPRTVATEEGYPLNIIVAKHRNGPVGTIPLRFVPQLTRFVDILPEERSR